jgi:4-azaleucine resistance transporter AzlC
LIIAANAEITEIFAIAWRDCRRSVAPVSAIATESTGDGAQGLAREGLPEWPAITRSAIGIGVYAGVFGVTFGAVSVTAGLSVGQTIALSALMFTGASQFALVGILGAGGSAAAGLSAALLLGLRNAFYGVPVTQIARPRGLRRLYTAHFVIDETTAMAVAQPTPRAGRYAFWATGLILFALWNLGSVAGALIGSGIDPSALGLDAAAPAIFLALLWPQLGRARARPVALMAAALALALVPLVPAGIPVIAAAVVAVAAGLAPAPTKAP